MAYKDKDKQREANAERQRRYRQSLLPCKAKGVTEQGETPEEIAKGVTSRSKTGVTNARRDVIKAKGVTIPSESHVDASDVGAVKALHQLINKPKRGKDIKVFADLPVTVQQTINILSDDKTELKRRTAIAINYQHQFPDRFHSVGAAG